MNARTKERARDERAYQKERQEFLTDRPCFAHTLELRWPDDTLVRCRVWADTVQHLRGRRGRLLRDQRWWLGLCWPCHRWAEGNPLEAKRLGLALSKVGVAS